MADEKLPLHDEAEARSEWRGQERENGDQDESEPERGSAVERGLEIRPPD